MSTMPKFRLTRNNYHSREANELYWSSSFVKQMFDCPARALAELREEYARKESVSLLIGSYVDAYFEGKVAFERFVDAHPEIFNSRTGELKAEYQKANKMIARVKKDKLFMSYLKGQKQKVFTGSIDGIPFKCKLDVYRKGERIVDFKTVKDFEPVYRPEEGKVSFAEYWRWPLQMAIYQYIEGNKLPCFLACVTKQDEPDISVVQIPQYILDAEIEVLREKLSFMDAVRQGIIEPERCDNCAYCRITKKLSRPLSLDEFTDF